MYTLQDNFFLADQNSEKNRPYSRERKSDQTQSVLKAYNLRNPEVNELRDKGKKTVWKVNTPTRSYILKKMPTSQSRTQFITDATSYLYQAGASVPQLYQTQSREKYVVYNGAAYILMEWFEGTQPEYTRHLEDILFSLGDFHQKSRGFIPSEEAKQRSHLGTWLSSYRQKREQLITFADGANNRNQSSLDVQFNALFLNNFASHLERMDRVIAYLPKSDYSTWVKKVDIQGSLCHQDFTPKNLRRLKNGAMVVFDLDSITYDLPARDLRKILNKVLKKKEFANTQTLQKMLAAYQDAHPLTAEQWEVVLLDLYFPHLFFGIVDKYYRNRATDWPGDKFIKTLKQAIRAEEKKTELDLRSFLP